jgi:hypothetical protein
MHYTLTLRTVWIIEILEPDIVMMMEAYFDESGTHAGSPVICVAGYLFTAEQAVHLDREWKQALEEFEVSHFHAADCGNGFGEFKPLAPEQCIELTKRLIGTIKRRMEIGVAVSLSETDFGQIEAPEWERGGPYMLCAFHALAAISGWADLRDYHEKISSVPSTANDSRPGNPCNHSTGRRTELLGAPACITTTG